MILIRTIFFIILLKTFSIYEIASEYTQPPNIPPNAFEPQLRISKGYRCSTQDYQFMVMIIVQYPNKPEEWFRICGGSLLSSDWVLTASHCIKPERKGTFAVLPAINRPDNKHFRVLVEKYVMHPFYNNETISNDIAMMLMAERVTDYVSFIKLPKEETKEADAVPCRDALVMGWGYTEDDSVPKAEELQCADIPMIPVSECKNLYYKHHHEKMSFNVSTRNNLCTLSLEGIDACRGDSGGPLMCGAIQVGIVSWGLECGVATNPGVYTRIDRYLKFIQKTVATVKQEDRLRNGSSFAIGNSLVVVLIFQPLLVL